MLIILVPEKIWMGGLSKMRICKPSLLQIDGDIRQPYTIVNTLFSCAGHAMYDLHMQLGSITNLGF